MKIARRVILLSLLLMPLFVLGWTPIASASEFRSDQNATVAKDEILNDTLYVNGSSVAIAGTVNGDVYCAGQNVIISGTVNGDVICAAQSIRIGGTVNGDIRVAAQFVEVSGKVDSNATVAAQSFVLQDGGAINGDATITSGTTDISGTVGRDIVASVNQLTVAGQIGRNAQVEVENLTLGSTAKVGGSFRYVSDRQAQVTSGAAIQGGVQRQVNKGAEEDKGAAWVALGYTLISLLAISMILVVLAPRLFQSVSEEGRLHLGRSVIAGLIGVVLFPVGIILLLFSIIGAPLAILFGVLWIMLLFLSGPVVAYHAGRLVLNRNGNAILYMLVGSLLLLVLYAVPILNAAVVVVVLVLGSGMLISRTLSRIGKPVYAIENTKKEK